MTNFFESESFVLPTQVRQDVAHRLAKTKKVKSLEFHFKGEALEGAKNFSDALLALKKRGAKISHEMVIKLAFPKTISREGALTLVENMPKPRNGSLKVRIEID
jgi:hypothetical protein